MDLIEQKENVNRHPWELSRTDSLIKEIRKYHNKGLILDIGCGDSYFDYQLLKTNINITKLYGVDIYLKKKIDINRYYAVNDYSKLKDKKFDTIIMLDVLEHIENDEEFLNNMVNKLLKNNGKVILTVPAHQFLYSKHDEFLKHYRRYNIKMIRELCKKTNYKIVNYHYFYFSLFLFRLLFRNTGNEVNAWKYKKNEPKTRFVRNILNIDYAICKFMHRLSNGLSLFVVLEKDIKQ